MDHNSIFSRACLWQSLAVISFAAMSSFAGELPDERWAESTEFVRGSKITLLSAVSAARAECPTGTPFRAGISRNHPTHAFEVLFLAEDQKRIVRVEIDVICGEPLCADEEPMPAKDNAVVAVFARAPPDRLEAALWRAAKLNQGTAIGAELRERKNAPSIGVVTLLTRTGINEILVEPLDEKPVHLVRRNE